MKKGTRSCMTYFVKLRNCGISPFSPSFWQNGNLSRCFVIRSQEMLVSHVTYGMAHFSFLRTNGADPEEKVARGKSRTSIMVQAGFWVLIPNGFLKGKTNNPKLIVAFLFKWVFAPERNITELTAAPKWSMTNWREWTWDIALDWGNLSF